MHLLPKENVRLFRYEDMISDFETWLSDLVKHCHLPYNKTLIQKMVNETSFNVKGEDIYSHKRNVKAGDHRNKLKPETIAELNKLFRNELEVLGYS